MHQFGLQEKSEEKCRERDHRRHNAGRARIKGTKDNPHTGRDAGKENLFTHAVFAGASEALEVPVLFFVSSPLARSSKVCGAQRDGMGDWLTQKAFLEKVAISIKLGDTRVLSFRDDSSKRFTMVRVL